MRGVNTGCGQNVYKTTAVIKDSATNEEFAKLCKFKRYLENMNRTG